VICVVNQRTSVLWAKKSIDAAWLPLIAHMSDAAETARLLWNEWLPSGMRRRIASGNVTEEFFIFLACAHDTGKASPIFQSKKNRFANLSDDTDDLLRQSIINAGLPLKDGYAGRKYTRHELVSYEIMRRNGFDDSVSVIVGAHHGRPPIDGQLRDLRGYERDCGFDCEAWVSIQDALLEHALQYAGLKRGEATGVKISRPSQVLLSGLVILADWIASDTALFPLIGLDTFAVDSAARAEAAFARLKLPERFEPQQDWDDLILRRFDRKTARPVQQELLNAARGILKPGIFVVEAPMGEGKTEAALLAAEVLANRAGCRGVYFALPSQATSDAMFSRLLKWIKTFDTDENQFSIRLMHGKAEMNDEYNAFAIPGNIMAGDEDEDNVAVHEWFSGRKKGILADFTAGTIDHVLIAGLKQKHLALRHLGLAAKVVIIDECHAYDSYMNSYLLTALRWLGAYGVPVIVLSATLPTERRDAVINAYLNKDAARTKTAYPSLTFTDGINVRQIAIKGAKRNKTIRVTTLNADELTDKLSVALEGGGCAGVIVNTVTRAQQIYALLEKRFGGDDIKLLHARFIAPDRASKEKELERLLGPEPASRPDRLIVVGTQVLEQSLDLDFDILISDLCPMDLLIQRIGRLHRHERARPARLTQAECCVLEAEGAFESGAVAVYGEYLLSRSLSCLPEYISLPDDIPGLVAAVYDDGDVMTELKAEYLERRRKSESRAGSFQISKPGASRTILNWLDDAVNDTEKHGEAAVREGDESIEVILLQKRNERFYLLPWMGNASPPPYGLNDEDAKLTARCTVRLPSVFGRDWLIKQTVKELEETMIRERLAASWNQSKWLKGALCLPLDENLTVVLCGFTLRYDRDMGLICIKNDKETEGYDGGV
jgi:CRISPR-associated endonuclease/helicase Cas3